MRTLIDNYWIEVTKFDPRVVGLYEKHYSARRNVPPSVRRQRGILRPGESMTLLTVDCRALFAWGNGIDDCIPPQSGINCAVFRNTGDVLSSELIKEADEMAWRRWPPELRHYTYVNADKIKSSHPGYCFRMAGWDYQRDERGNPVKTKGGLYILEIFANEAPTVKGGEMKPWEIVIKDNIDPGIRRKIKRILKPVRSIGNPQKCLFCGIDTTWTINHQPVCPKCSVEYGFLGEEWLGGPCEVCGRQSEWWTEGDPQHDLCYIHRDAWFHWTMSELGLIDSKVEPEKWHQAWAEGWARFIAAMKEREKLSV